MLKEETLTDQFLDLLEEEISSHETKVRELNISIKKCQDYIKSAKDAIFVKQESLLTTEAYIEMLKENYKQISP